VVSFVVIPKLVHVIIILIIGFWTVIEAQPQVQEIVVEISNVRTDKVAGVVAEDRDTQSFGCSCSRYGGGLK
jgi:hypothetical protein